MIFNAIFWCYAYYGTQGDAYYNINAILLLKNGAREQSLANKSMVKAKLKKLKLLVISKCEIEKQTFFK